MRSLSRFLWTLSILSLPLLLRGQDIQQMPTGAQTLTRLAYDSTAATQRGDLRHVCLSITRDGEYQMIRTTSDKPTQYLRGQMAKEQFEALKNLLSAKQFRSQSGNLGGLIRQDSESFRAEMPAPLTKRADDYVLPPSESWRLDWLNPDDVAPFPISISKVIHWLQTFDPKDGQEFSYTEFSQVCPSGGMRLVQPSIADNQRR
ncbi:MAG TPA: hypothetical protein VMP68_05620 [Candidatus Eisenbacteria bacterium]|nr:hypothetical protein [Candidatus Eisenbacteria bacterium]